MKRMSFVDRLRRASGRFLPGPVARRFATGLWRAMGIRVETASGLEYLFANRNDWVAFHEIFVRRDYDSAIARCLSGAPRDQDLVVLDLGANTGLFALHLIDRAAANHFDLDRLRILCVEGSGLTFQRLAQHVGTWSTLVPGLNAIHGLVGRRSGTARISEDWDHLGNSVARGVGGGREVPYVDLFDLCASFGEIALVKCDIEGSEIDLIGEYGELLDRARVLAIEFHGSNPEVDASRTRLASLGFVRLAGTRQVIYDGTTASLEVFEKQPRREPGEQQ